MFVCVRVCVCVCFCRCVCVCVCLRAFVYLCVTTHVKPARDHLTLDDLKISMFLSLSFSFSRCVRVCSSSFFQSVGAVMASSTRAHMHAARVFLICLPHTHHVHGGEVALARVLSRAHKMRGPALINLNDCMACDYSDLCCSGSWQRERPHTLAA